MNQQVTVGIPGYAPVAAEKVVSVYTDAPAVTSTTFAAPANVSGFKVTEFVDMAAPPAPAVQMTERLVNATPGVVEVDKFKETIITTPGYNQAVVSEQKWVQASPREWQNKDTHMIRNIVLGLAGVILLALLAWGIYKLVKRHRLKKKLKAAARHPRYAIEEKKKALITSGGREVVVEEKRKDIVYGRDRGGSQTKVAAKEIIVAPVFGEEADIAYVSSTAARRQSPISRTSQTKTFAAKEKVLEGYGVDYNKRAGVYSGSNGFAAVKEREVIEPGFAFKEEKKVGIPNMSNPFSGSKTVVYEGAAEKSYGIPNMSNPFAGSKTVVYEGASVGSSGVSSMTSPYPIRASYISENAPRSAEIVSEGISSSNIYGDRVSKGFVVAERNLAGEVPAAHLNESQSFEALNAEFAQRMQAYADAKLKGLEAL